MTHFITIDTSSNITGVYTDAPGYAPIPTGAIPIPDTVAAILRKGFKGYTYINNVVGGTLTVFDPTALLVSAKAALAATDSVAFRCFKAGIPFPSNWKIYTIMLRGIVSGVDRLSTTLPPKPDYPVGS